MGKGLLRLILDRRAQTAFEYLLVAGAVVVLIAVAVMTGFPAIWSQFIGALCPSVDPVGSTGAGQCLGR